jgi:hypothetical protein
MFLKNPWKADFWVCVPRETAAKLPPPRAHRLPENLRISCEEILRESTVYPPLISAGKNRGTPRKPPKKSCENPPFIPAKQKEPWITCEENC